MTTIGHLSLAMNLLAAGLLLRLAVIGLVAVTVIANGGVREVPTSKRTTTRPLKTPGPCPLESIGLSPSARRFLQDHPENPDRRSEAKNADGQNLETVLLGQPFPGSHEPDKQQQE